MKAPVDVDALEAHFKYAKRGQPEELVTLAGLVAHAFDMAWEGELDDVDGIGSQDRDGGGGRGGDSAYDLDGATAHAFTQSACPTKSRTSAGLSRVTA